MRADTVHMNDGGFIKDCRVGRTDALGVHVRTPGGNMAVPPGAIARIEKGKSIFDTFDEKRAQVRDSDAEGLYKLALWCRQSAGLRKELDEVLEKVIEAQPDHEKARRLLGHYRSGKEWKQPDQLSLLIRSKGPKEQQDAFFAQLSVAIQTRRDVWLVPSLKNAEEIDGCELAIEAANGKSAVAKFYGQVIRGPTDYTVVTMGPVAKWIGKEPPKIVLNGEVPQGISNPAIACIIDAFTQNQKAVHNLLDQVLEIRARRLEGILDDPQPAASPASATPAEPPAPAGKKPAGKKKEAPTKKK